MGGRLRVIVVVLVDRVPEQLPMKYVSRPSVRYCEHLLIKQLECLPLEVLVLHEDGEDFGRELPALPVAVVVVPVLPAVEKKSCLKGLEPVLTTL